MDTANISHLLDPDSGEPVKLSVFNVNLDTKEILYNHSNYVWTIRNRDYRDDTNDADVEETIYNHLKSI